jgi:hypothetical protein
MGQMKLSKVAWLMTSFIAAMFLVMSCSCSSTVGDRVVLQAMVPQMVNIADAETVCADLLGVEGNLVAGWMTQCEVQKWVGDTLVTFRVIGSPLLPPLDDDGTYPPPDPVEPEQELKPNPHEHQDDEDQPCERHRQELEPGPGEFAI